MKTAVAALVFAVLPVQNDAPERINIKIPCNNEVCVVPRAQLEFILKTSNEHAKARFACENAQRT